MKKIILTTATALFIGFTAFAQFGNMVSQGLEYDVHGAYARPVHKNKLDEARSISDVIAGYPVNWVTNYISVEVMATCSGRTLTAVNTNARLTEKQKYILDHADQSTDIVVNVNYRYRHPVTDAMEDNKMHVAVTVVPETEAEFIGGKKQLKKYLKETSIDKLPEAVSKQLVRAVVRFTVDEQGRVTNARIKRSSGDAGTDQLLLESINAMPGWKPAENAKGEKVKQEFEYSINSPNRNAGC